MSMRRFTVALSFPGERRDFIEQVAAVLASGLGQHRVFFDKFYEAELARPDLDIYLGNLYREQSDLVVPFYSADYERKKWCRLEWRHMRDILHNMESEWIMPFRFDDTQIQGVLSIDGYVKIGDRSPQEVAELILERLTPREFSQTIIGAFSHLTPLDANVLNRASALLEEETDPDSRLESKVLLSRLRQDGVDDEQFFDSIEILDGRAHIKGERVFGGRIPFFTVPTSTFGNYLRANIQDYDRIVEEVIIEIVRNRMMNSDEIARKLGARQIYVAHIFNELEVQRLIGQDTLFQGPRVARNISAELKRHVQKI